MLPHLIHPLFQRGLVLASFEKGGGAQRRRIFSPSLNQTQPKMFTPFRHDLKLKAKKLRKDLTPAEKKLWFGYLRSNISAKFLRQKPIGNYIVDFYCAEKKLVIEVDGDSHFLSEEAVLRDCERERVLKEKYHSKILRFLNCEVMKNFEGVCEEIERNLK